MKIERPETLRTRCLVGTGLLAMAMLLASNAAFAGDGWRHREARRAEAREDLRAARDYDRRLDRRGNAIDRRNHYISS